MSGRWRDHKGEPGFEFHAWMRTVDELEDQISDLVAALRLFEAQWNACGPNSDFGRYFSNVRDAARNALAKAEAQS